MWVTPVGDMVSMVKIKPKSRTRKYLVEHFQIAESPGQVVVRDPASVASVAVNRGRPPPQSWTQWTRVTGVAVAPCAKKKEEKKKRGRRCSPKQVTEE